MWIIRTDTAAVARLDTAGDVVRAFAWEALAREVARADIDAYVDAFLPSAGQDPDRRQEIEQLRDPDLAASRHPSAIDLRTDALGRIWVAERHDWDRLHARTWLIFDPEGRLLARMEPTDEVLDVLDADETHVLLRFTDELGVQGVELRRITVTRAGAPEP